MTKNSRNHGNNIGKPTPTPQEKGLPIIRIFEHFKLYDWFKIVGGLFLFLAWYADKTQSDWVVEKESLKRSQMVINLLEVERANYEHPLEIARRQEKKDSTDIAFLEQRLARVYLDLLTQSIGRVAQKNGIDSDFNRLYAQEVGRKNCMDTINRANLVRGNYPQINDSFNQAFLRYSQNFFAFEEIFKYKWGYVSDKSDSWDKTFRWAYWVGSVSLAIGFVLEKNQSRKPR